MLREGARGLMRPLLQAAYSSSKPVMTRRGIAPMCSPPKTPITLAETWVLGVGSIVVMMIPVLYGMYSIPNWADEHRRTD